MGIQQNNTGPGFDFLTINSKTGNFQSGSKAKGDQQVYEPGRVTVTGTIVKIDCQNDEYEGQESMKARVFLKDDSGQKGVAVTFTIFTEANEASAFGLNLLGKLAAVPEGQSIGIMPWHMEKGTKMGDSVVENEGGLSGSSVYEAKFNPQTKQYDINRQHSFKPEFPVTGDFAGGSLLPSLEKVKVGAKEVINKEPWNNLLEQLLETLTTRYTGKPRQEATQTAQDGPAEEPGVDPHELVAAVAAAEAMAVAAPAVPADTGHSSRFARPRQ